MKTTASNVLAMIEKTDALAAAMTCMKSATGLIALVETQKGLPTFKPHHVPGLLETLERAWIQLGHASDYLADAGTSEVSTLELAPSTSPSWTP